MIRLFAAFSGVLFLGGIGSFFLFVPPLLIAMVFLAMEALLLTGLTLVYHLGVDVDLQLQPPPGTIEPKD